jgi:hypothetical protein
MSSDGLPDQQRANLTSAAWAAASWARARRATWTDVPLGVHAPALEDPASPEELGPIPAAAPPPLPPPLLRLPPVQLSPVPLPPVPLPSLSLPSLSLPPLPLKPLPLPPAASETPGPSVGARVAEQVRALGGTIGRWLPRLASVQAIAALLAIVVAGVVYWWSSAATSTPRIAVREPVSVRPQGPPRKATGGLRVSSTPAGARVLVDGKARGVTPLTLTDVIPGSHEIELKSDAGSVKRSVTVAADKTAEITESIFSGWLAVYSPFDLDITEGGRALRLDDRHQVMLPPGQHELRLVNRALEYEAVRQVQLKPGEVTNLSLTAPPSTMTVTATEAAEVWLDGARVGVTPLNAVSVELGTHEIVVKRTTGGERRFTVTMTVKPFTLNVDFSKPAV